jgi:RND family efflux transporter MFP subunit
MTLRIFTITSLGAGLLAAGACGTPAVEKVETTAAVPVTVEAARVDKLTSSITVAGTIVPAPGADWIVSAPGPARISEMPKNENDVVHQGDVLVRFEIPTLGADLEVKQAEVTQAMARLETAKAKVTRATALLAQGVGAAREVEDAKLEQSVAEGALAQAKTGIIAAQVMADRAVVRARFDGVVAKRWHNPGDLVDAATGDPILRIINPRELQIVASVPMSQLAHVVTGHAARIIGPGGGDGVAAMVLNRPAQVDPASSTADVRLSFRGPTNLPAGTVVTVSIVSEEHPNALVVPTAAIVYEEGEIFVMVAAADKTAHKYPVVLGLATHDLTEITVGIKAGDLVIVTGQEGLPDGGAIQVIK